MSKRPEIPQYAADVTKLIGTSILPNGKTIREVLTIDGVSLWDVVTPLLAAFWLPKEIARKTQPSFYAGRLKPHLALIKQYLRSLISVKRGSKGCPSWPSDNVFLLLGFSGYMYRDVLEPVRSYFSEKGNVNCVIIHDEGCLQKTAVKLSGECVHSIWWYRNSVIDAEVRTMRLALKSSVSSLISVNLLRWLVESIGSDLGSRVEGTFNWLFKVYLPALLPYLAIARHILMEKRPSLIIASDNADPRTRIFYMVGRLLGIPSLEVQFGLHSKNSVEWQFLAADRVAVWGENVRKSLINTHDVPEERVTTTGSPRFDGLSQSDEARSRLGISDNKVMVLFASLYLLDHYSEFGDYPEVLKSVKKSIFSAVSDIEGMVLVVKPHPLENVRDTRHIAKGYKDIVFVDQRDDIRELIRACDVFITLGSTSTMDALVAKKIVVFPAFPGLVWWNDMYLKNNVTVEVKSEEELSCVLKEVVGGQSDRLLKDMEPSRQNFLRGMVHQADGHASARIADLAIQMAGINQNTGIRGI